MACEYRAGANCVNKRQPSDCLRSQIYVDTMMFPNNGLEHLVNEMGASQICFGSDLPFSWSEPLELINSATYRTEDERVPILHGNLARLLKLSS